MNEQYEKTIQVDGKTYWYDPDHDIYHRRYEPMSTFDKYSWIVLILILITIITLMGWWN
jgi:hypothetical protein